MRRLSNTAIKRIIAGSLALALTFTSVGLNNFTWADEDEVEEVQEVDTDDNANPDETIDEGSESELPTDEVTSTDEETEEVASNDENSEEATDTESSKEATNAETSEEEANSKDATSESDDTEKCEHEDTDEDGTCDKCGKSMSDEEAEVCEHVDEDEDGICDKCSEEMPKEDTEELETEKVFELNATEIKLGIDDTFMVTATLDGEDVTESIELSTDDKAVSVEDYTISANKEGEAVVTAKYVDDEDTYTSSIDVVVVDEIIIDDYKAYIMSVQEVQPILVASEDDVEDALPKAVKGSIAISEYDLEENGYTADDLLANGFVYSDLTKVYSKDNANIEVKWQSKGVNEAGGYEYAGKIASKNYSYVKYLTLPEATIYVYDGEYSGKLDPNTFIPIATDGNPVSSFDGELELNRAYPSRISAWEAKYITDNFDYVLKFDKEFIDSLKPETKAIVESRQSFVRYSDAFVKYITELPISNFLVLKDAGKVDLSSSSIAGTDFTDEQLKRLGSYGFTILDVAQYIDAYNGFDNASIPYRLHMMGQHSESLDYLYAVVDEKYHTNDIIYINGKRTNYKNIETLEVEEAVEEVIDTLPTIATDGTVENSITDDIITTSSEKTNFLSAITNKFAFITASAAETEKKEPPVREGDGWFDRLATGTGDTLEFKAPTGIIHIDKHPELPDVQIVGKSSHVKTVKETNQYAFCASPWKGLKSTTYRFQKFYSNGYAALWCDERFSYEDRQALMWYKCGVDADTNRLEAFKREIYEHYIGHPIFYGVIAGGEQWVINTYGTDIAWNQNTGYALYVATSGGANQQILFVPQIGTTSPPDDIMISTETRYATGYDDTYYKTDLDKYSVITNEKLSKIHFRITEHVNNNPRGSSDLYEGKRDDVYTNDNGYVAETFHHHAEWSIPYEVIKDEGAILEYIGTGEASPDFVDYYNTLRAAIDSGNDGIMNESKAYAEVERLRAAFKAVEYDYTWEELDKYERKPSSQDQNNKTLNLISLPKQGYRMNITKIDNSNKYSAVSNSDLTSPSTKTTSAVHDGGNGHVDISNQPWRAQIFINKTDLETNNQIKYDTKFDIYEMENGKYPEEPSKNYRVVRINEEIANEMNWDKSTIGMYTIEYIGTTFGGTNPADDKQHTPLKYGTVYYTQSNTGKFKIVETKAPSYEEGKTGYIGNFAKRPYTRVENDLDSRFALSGRTDKTYPTPQQIVKVAAGNYRYCQFKKVLHHLYGQE